MLVGAIGMALWTLFNPYGPAAAPIMAAQVVGAAASGMVGAAFRRSSLRDSASRMRIPLLMLAASLCTILFYLPVNAVDAWVFQPFWPRFLTGALWACISLGGNMIIFPLLFPTTRYLYDRGWAIQ